MSKSGTQTQDKRVTWSLDWYNALSDDFCLICLSEKQRYLVSQMLQQISWKTRWDSDVSSMDIIQISDDLNEAIMNPKCGELSTLIYNMQDLLLQVQQLQATIENGGTPIPDESMETPYYQYDEINQSETVGGLIIPCGTTQEKDALYGGIHELVEYILNVITDLIEQFRNASTAIPEKLDFLISAVPVYETLPIDEIFGFAAYLAEEVEEVWDATVTEDRKQDFKCKLFCAALANDCKLTPELIVSILGLEAPQALEDIIASSLRDTLSIIVAGQPIGDELFYSMIGVMLLTVLAGEQWLNARGWRPFEHRFLSGVNSPDNDWTIFCTDCPQISWNVDYRFFDGSGEQGWEVINGTFDSVFYSGENLDYVVGGGTVSRRYVKIARDFTEPLPTVNGVGIVFDAIAGCGITGMGINLFRNAVNVGGFGISPTLSGTLRKHAWGYNGSLQVQEVDRIEIEIDSRNCYVPSNLAYARIHGVRLNLAQQSDMKGFPSYDAMLGLTANGSGSDDLWKGWSVL